MKLPSWWALALTLFVFIGLPLIYVVIMFGDGR